MMRHFNLFLCILTTCLCRVNSTFYVNNDTSKNCDLLTKIDSGWVCGRVRPAEENVMYASFRGIPYAKQPVGELRFKELQPAEPWDDVRIATEEGPICPQYDEIYGRLARPVKGMNESCMFVNVHVPLDAFDPGSKQPFQKSNLSIVVFIHGGGFQSGSGDADVHGPEFLVSKEVILITFNYRLNVFGFLSLNSSSIPGNNGLRDVITLLKWVRRNARAFGGDPDNITLAGQSVGATAAHLVTLSKASNGLVRRLICMSGVANGGYYTTSPAYAKTVATMFLGYLGINSTDADEIHQQLIEMPLEKLMEANRITQKECGLVSFVPVAELTELPNVTRIIDDYPENLIKQGRGQDVPMIVGSTNVECEYFNRRIRYLNLMELIKEDSTLILPPNITYSVNTSVALNLSKIMEDRYFQGEATVEKYINCCTYSFFRYPAFKLAQWRASLKAAPVYLYLYNFDSDYNIVKNGRMLNYQGGGAHLEDQTFVLRVNSMMGLNEKSFPPRTRDDLMKDWMTTRVVNFMQCSHPVCNNLTAWAPADDLNYQLIEDPIIISNTNMTQLQRDMFEFQDNIYAMAGMCT